MKLTQLSLFLENKPAHLKVPCRALSDAGISILTLALADTEQFGILRLIVREPERAKEVLEAAGCVVNTTEVVAVEIEDRPGGLAALLDVIDEQGINIEYMYAFTFGREDKAIMVFRFENPDEAIERLQGAGIGVVASVDLYARGG